MKANTPFEGTMASIRAALFWEEQQRQRSGLSMTPASMTPRFVTISRQAGAGGRTVARLLADRLDAEDPSSRPWLVWDRELVEKVAEEQHIPESLVESLEHPRSWVEEFLGGLSAGGDGEELDQLQVFRRVATTIRGLARAGRAIIVGRGGVYATRDLPGGVHIRLVAPLEFRVANLARLYGTGEAQAAKEVHRLDHERETFHRRYWAGKALLPEIFTVTFNVFEVRDERLVASVLPLVLPSAGARLSAPVTRDQRCAEGRGVEGA
jgi:hypothetical protein